MVRYGRFTSLLLLLGQIIQEEVDQDGIDLGTRIRSDDLSSDHLNSPDTAAAQLNFVW